MILILTDSFDVTTNFVIDWLIDKNKKYLVINSNEQINLIYQDLDECIFEMENGKYVALSSVTSFWFRRGMFKFGKNDFSLISEKFEKIIRHHLNKEMEALYHFFNTQLTRINHLSSIFNCHENKLNILHLAREVGLRIPATSIVSTKQDLIDFKKKNGSIISKAINYSFSEFIDGEDFTNFTEEISNSLIGKLPEKFYPSLIQEKVDKLFEIRVFFLKGEFYSMAIFSQQDKKTSIDFRKYNYVKPNRTVPYKLHISIVEKLLKLLNRLQHNTASIDFIYAKTEELIFLEINPVGQFGMVSYPCNYYLEKKVANELK